MSVITIRLDPALHKALKRVAWQQKKSLNELAVEALASVVPANVPDAGKLVAEKGGKET